MIGQTFGNYRLVLRLGSGAMGTVFLGEHERIARRAAVKVLSPEFAEDAEILRRFFDEARATSLIHHPAIVEVIDCGVHPDGGRPYIVMEYLTGETLAAYLERSGPLPWREACAIGRQLADGLGAAHRLRIVHRDVKPANVMRIVDPGAATPSAPAAIKVLDFGVAKLLYDTLSGSRTHPGKLLGTPEYMAPEQCNGEGPVDERTDVYGLGCVLFEMVCGHPPFVAKTLGELIVAHRWRQPPVASAYATLPDALDRLVSRMLSKQPADRPPNMTSVTEALCGALEGVGDSAATPLRAREVPGPPGFKRALPASRRPRAPARVLALAGGFGVVTAFGVMFHLTEPRGSVADRKPPSAPRAAAVRPALAQALSVPPPGPPALAQARSVPPPGPPALAPARSLPPAPTPAPGPVPMSWAPASLPAPALLSAAPPMLPAAGPPPARPGARLSPEPAERPATERRASTPRRTRAGRPPEIDADGIVDL